MAKTQFPILFKKGLVKIYLTPSGKFEAYTVTWIQHGKRQRRKFSDLKKARSQAQSVLVQIEQGRLDKLTLSGEHRDEYLRAKDRLKDTGSTLERAVDEYAEAYEILKGPHVLEAARYFARRNIHSLPVISVQDAVKEFLGSIDRPVYLKLQRAYLRRFSEAFQMDLKQVRSKDIDDFLRALPLAERSKKNTRDAVKALMIHAAGQGWIPKDDDTMDSVRKFRNANSDVAIWIPEQLASVMTHAREEIIPWIAFRAFSTIRDSELGRLDWGEVGAKSIRITKGKGNVPTRRLIPIAKNLEEWIQPFRQKSGPISPFVNTYKQFKKACDAAGVEYSRNRLRHSAITYRVALTGDVNRTAIESGNSVSVIHQSYLELVEKDQAKAWFSISPDVSEKVVLLSKISGAS